MGANVWLTTAWFSDRSASGLPNSVSFRMYWPALMSSGIATSRAAGAMSRRLRRTTIQTPTTTTSGAANT